MKTIRVGNKEYPFILSSAAAKEYFIEGSNPDDDDPLNTKAAIQLIHKGMQDAALIRPFWARLFNRIPSKNKISRLLELSDVLEITQGVFPKIETDEKKDQEEKKPSPPMN